MRGHDMTLVRNAEAIQHFARMLHRVPVRGRTHDDGDKGAVHAGRWILPVHSAEGLRVRIRLGLLLAALLSLPVHGQSRSPARLEVPYQQFTLNNGLTVILHRDTTVPVVSVNIWYHVGSANERPGRTGLAHLFEHLMFEGSAHVAEGAFDSLLEANGASSNGSTENDRTNYFMDLPANALELALFLESDRMAYLLDTMSPERVNGQRDVVKNERRQSYENQPYGMASIELDKMLWPPGHPYHWPTIGSMDDLTAASHEDITAFFKTYYAPNNASLVIAGDIDLARTRALVEKWFSEVPRGPVVPPVDSPVAVLSGVKRQTMTDQVRLPRLYLGWITTQAYAPGDAALDVASSVLAGGKNSRLYTRLVYDMQIAQDVHAVQQSAALGGSFLIIATARPGHAWRNRASSTTSIPQPIGTLSVRACRAMGLRHLEGMGLCWLQAAEYLSNSLVQPHRKRSSHNRKPNIYFFDLRNASYPPGILVIQSVPSCHGEAE